jgi:UDP-N-acetylmuramoylalanine--D-glutamate ligase
MTFAEMNLLVDMGGVDTELHDRAVKSLAGLNVVVAGLGRSGMSAARFLRRCGALVTATDLRPASEITGALVLEAMDVKIEAESGFGPFDGYDLVVTSPGVPQGTPILAGARAAGVEVISEIELAYRFIDAPVIAVAGTNGKSTVTALLGKVLETAGLKVFVGGNIGTPAIEYVESVMDGDSEADYCVLEVSSFQLETVSSFAPRVALLLNITPDHLDRYAGFKDYADTKFRLFDRQTGADCAVINADDPVIDARMADGLTEGGIVPYSLSSILDVGLYLSGADIVYAPETGALERYPTDGFSLKGLHNIENVMAVIGAARRLKIPGKTVLKALKDFKGLVHRMEPVRELDGVTYIDDSKGTNIGALAMALRSVETPVVLIAGGRDKGGDYSILSEAVKEKVSLMILIGEAAPRIKEALSSATKVEVVASMEEAVRAAHAGAHPGETVLLSPACSSFDMFSGYKERGERFKALVKSLC